jgi:undecaprenyl-diphosphatase
VRAASHVRAGGTAASDVRIQAPDPPAFTRSATTILRLVVAGAVTLLGLILATGGKQTLAGLEADLLAFLTKAPQALERFLIGLLQYFAIALPVVVTILLLALRKVRLWLMALAGSIVAAAAIRGVIALLDRTTPPRLSQALAQPGWVGGAAFPDSAYIAGSAAALTVLWPFLGRRWRHVGAWILILFVALRLVTTGLALNMGLSLGLGWFVGELTLLLFGSPNRRATPREVAEALVRAGLPLAELDIAHVDARGSVPYFGTLRDGGRIFAKALGSEERSSDLLFRVYRYVRVRDVGDERPFSSLRRAVEHEGLLALKARDVGVRTPHLLSIADVGDDVNMLLAYEAIEGRSLDGVDVEELTDPVLDAVWSQVLILRQNRIAHRDLRLANVFLASDGTPWMIDFGFSELAVHDEVLANDVVELLCSTTTAVGPARSVASAERVIGVDALNEAAPRIQPAVLSSATRKAMDARPEKFKDLQQEVQRVTGLEKIRYEQLHRVSGKRVLTVAAIGLAFYFLIPQLADVGNLWTKVKTADWGWATAAFLASLLSYAGAAISAAGAVPNKLLPLPLLEAQFASSFVNRITPASVGGMAVSVRFYEKSGINSATSVAGVGIDTIAGFAVHILLTLIFILWAGRRGIDELPHPHGSALLIGLSTLFVLSGAVAFTPWGRKVILPKVTRPLKQAIGGVRQIATAPGKLLALFGGSTLITLSYVVAMYFAILAFHGHMAFATAGAVYLIGSAVATAAPTPGGIGATEALLITGYTAAGLNDSIAVAAVFLFRIATFWIPILPGWLAFIDLQHRDRI